MKKIIIFLAALAVFCSCKKDDVETDVDTDALFNAYDYDPEPELEEPELKVDVNTGAYYGVSDWAHMRTSALELCDYKYELWCGFPYLPGHQLAEDYQLEKYFRGVNNNVDFLMSVTTTSTKYWSKDGRNIGHIIGFGYLFTDDLNYQSGGGWVRAYFGGQYENAKQIFDDENDPDELYVMDHGIRYFHYKNGCQKVCRDDGKIITGLRAVVNTPKTDPPATIKDPVMEGVTWHIAPSYYGNKDLNFKSGGDDLYLYYTKDYTGREITLVNPYLSSVVSGMGDEVSYKNYSIYYQLLGSICTWNGYKDTESWKPTAHDLKEDVITQAAIQVQDSKLYDASWDYLEDHFDFVMLYDRDMKQTFESVGDNDRPANLNRNAGGARQFLSYSYITPNDTEWWVEQ